MFCTHLHIFSMFLFFFFNDTATTEIYTLSLHDALPISRSAQHALTSMHTPASSRRATSIASARVWTKPTSDRKSTRLNSSHSQISYAVFCLKKKKKKKKEQNASTDVS